MALTCIYIRTLPSRDCATGSTSSLHCGFSRCATQRAAYRRTTATGEDEGIDTRTTQLTATL